LDGKQALREGRRSVGVQDGGVDWPWPQRVRRVTLRGASRKRLSAAAGGGRASVAALSARRHWAHYCAA